MSSPPPSNSGSAGGATLYIVSAQGELALVVLAFGVQIAYFVFRTLRSHFGPSAQVRSPLLRVAARDRLRRHHVQVCLNAESLPTPHFECPNPLAVGVLG